MSDEFYNRFDNLQKEMRRFLEHMRKMHPVATGFATDIWKPNVNICETEAKYIVVAEVPGIDPGRIQVRVQGNKVTLHGERVPISSGVAERCLHLEITSGPFRRDIEVPGPIDPNAVEAQYKDGILKILLQKKRPAGDIREISIDSQD